MYNRNQHTNLCFLLIATLFISSSCSGSSIAQSNGKPPVKDNLTKTITKTTDEQLFRSFLKKFKTAAAQKNVQKLQAMINFPLQTLPQWTNDELKSATVNPTEGLVSQGEYQQYEKVLFSVDALRLIPASKEDDLSEIDKNTAENYYKTIAKNTDKGSTLYELQQQYVQSGGKETSYGFVFGKIKGQYKIISYFSPWPVKG